MSHRQIVAIAVLMAIALWAGAHLQAQRSGDILTLVQPSVVAGPDVGFRVERVERGIPIGKLVVKINGNWVDAQFSGGVVRAAQE